jgi:hypothetical protein
MSGWILISYSKVELRGRSNKAFPCFDHSDDKIVSLIFTQMNKLKGI